MPFPMAMHFQSQATVTGLKFALGRTATTSLPLRIPWIRLTFTSCQFTQCTWTLCFRTRPSCMRRRMTTRRSICCPLPLTSPVQLQAPIPHSSTPRPQRTALTPQRIASTKWSCGWQPTDGTLCAISTRNSSKFATLAAFPSSSPSLATIVLLDTW